MRIAYIEPYEAGSHRSFGRVLTRRVAADWRRLTLPGRHWKWRMRGSGVYFAHAEAFDPPPDLLFASSYLPLADLVALRPTLATVPSVLYFHENQLAFPVRGAPAERDTHFGFTQLVSARVATVCAFNSAWNRDSFLDAGAALLRRLPDAVPPGWIGDIAARSVVLPVPLDLPGLFPDGIGDGIPDGISGGPPDGNHGLPDDIEDVSDPSSQDGIGRGIGDIPIDRSKGPLIVWNHRWEHDKAPEAFFEALFALADRAVPFRVAVCGQRFTRTPAIFESARERLGARVEHWGFLPSRGAYHALLARSDLAVSTAIHEFFGISMLEATWFGARPVVPDRLSYPEIFPDGCRYAEGALLETLAAHCRAYVDGASLRGDRRALVRPFGPALIERYRALFAGLVAP